MSESGIIWVLIGVFLTLSYESLLRFIKPNNKVDELKNTKESEGDAKNPDGTNKVKDETLFSSFPISEVKLVMVVREDLKMGKGKIGAQCGHATIGAYEQVVQYAKKSAYWKKVLNNWSWEGQKKVCVKVMSEQELLDIESKARENSIPAMVIADAGLTQIKEGSLTVLGLGPAPSKMVNQITGHLKLL